MTLDIKQARTTCECTMMGIAKDGMEAKVNPNVVGVGLGHRTVNGLETEDLALRVFVKQKQPKILLRDEEFIPQTIEGIPTDIEEVGEVKARWPLPPVRQRKLRPARPGVSIGHPDVSAGTFGVLVRGRLGETMVLSNNHVLANVNQASKGDVILQPGPWDGGRPDRDAIAHLVDYEEIAADTVNTVDAAVARVYRTEDVAPDIIGVGQPRGVSEPQPGMEVRKSGRTTRLTKGHVSDVQVTIRVMYPEGSYVFEDQFLISGRGRFSGPGDSGSAILDKDRRICGLLFGGSPLTTVANRFSKVTEALNVKPV
jgi:hypothetical protein